MTGECGPWSSARFEPVTLHICDRHLNHYVTILLLMSQQRHHQFFAEEFGPEITSLEKKCVTEPGVWCVAVESPLPLPQ